MNIGSNDQQQTICGIKDLLGRKWSDPGLQTLVKDLPFKVTGKDDEPVIVVEVDGKEKSVTPVEIYTMFFGRLKEMAEDLLQHKVTQAVATVPATYNDNQRQAVRDAGERANLEILRIVNEPTAATIAYGILDRTYYSNERLILVYDIGASKIDVAVIELDQGAFEILATTSANIGGNDINKRLVA